MLFRSIQTGLARPFPPAIAQLQIAHSSEARGREIDKSSPINAANGMWRATAQSRNRAIRYRSRTLLHVWPARRAGCSPFKCPAAAIQVRTSPVRNCAIADCANIFRSPQATGPQTTFGAELGEQHTARNAQPHNRRQTCRTCAITQCVSQHFWQQIKCSILTKLFIKPAIGNY